MLRANFISLSLYQQNSWIGSSTLLGVVGYFTKDDCPPNDHGWQGGDDENDGNDGNGGNGGNGCNGDNDYNDVPVENNCSCFDRFFWLS